MKVCPKCGKIIYDGDPEYNETRFCENCRGVRLVEKTEGDDAASRPPDDENQLHDVKTGNNGPSRGASSPFAGARSARPEHDWKSTQTADGYNPNGDKRGNARFGGAREDGNSTYSHSPLDDKIEGKINDIDAKLGKLDEPSPSAKTKAEQSSVKFQRIVDKELGSCDCLKVEFNKNIFAVFGYNSLIQLRMTPLREELEDVYVFWKVGDDGSMKQARLDFMVNMENGRDLPVRLEFMPKNKGKQAVSFYFLCKNKSGYKCYNFSEEVIVYSDEQIKSGDITVYVDNDVKHAGDVRHNVYNITNQGGSVNQLLERLREEPLYCTKKLITARKEIEKELIRRITSSDRLLLTFGSHRLCVFGKTSVRLGREREWNDIQIHKPDCPLDMEPYCAVSGRHGLLVIDDYGKVTYEDTSRHGTRINGAEVIRGRCCSLPLNYWTMLEITWLGMDVQPQACQKAHDNDFCRNCKGGGQGACSLLVKRRDDVPESYLMVPYCCRLGEFFPEMKGFTLYNQGGGFLLATPQGERRKLRSGMVAQGSGTAMEVLDFEQL